MARYSLADFERVRTAYQPYAPENLAECWLIGENDAAEGNPSAAAHRSTACIGWTNEEVAAYAAGFEHEEAEHAARGEEQA